MYGGLNRLDWRTIDIDRTTFNPDDVERMLLPTVRPDIVEAAGGAKPWITSMIADCRDRLRSVIPLKDSEVAFLDNLMERGQITPELLTSDNALRTKIKEHPMLNWKALNVRRHHGLGS